MTNMERINAKLREVQAEGDLHPAAVASMFLRLFQIYQGHDDPMFGVVLSGDVQELENLMHAFVPLLRRLSEGQDVELPFNV